MTNEQRTELIAVACHQAWYAYTVLALGEPGETWTDAPDWQQESIRNAVDFWDEAVVKIEKEDGDVTFSYLLEKLCPMSHENWMAHKTKEGWIYGEVKDPEAKTHHCMVPYVDLPEAQKKKDKVVVAAYLELRSLFKTRR